MTTQPQQAPITTLAELIQHIPKTDLHLHLDGSIRLGTIAELGQRDGIKLPSYTAAGLDELVFKSHYRDLEEYLTTFGYSCAVMQNPENIERIAYELAVDNQNENVRYIEVRFAPQLHINKNMDMRRVLESVNKGLLRAQQEFNQRPAIREGLEPPFQYGIIVCAMRYFDGNFSDYYANLVNVHAYSSLKSIRELGSYELAQGAVRIRDEQGIPVVGFDLAGAENGYPASQHRRAFQYAHQHFMAKTVHAGEAYGAPSIFQAITDLHADRIGHGYYLFNVEKIENDESIRDKAQYIEELCNYIAAHRITIEVCLTSNMQTNPTIGTLSNHAFQHMIARELSVTICTDNRTVSKTTVSNEIMLALKTFRLTEKQFKNLIVYGFKRSFFHDTYANKRKWVRQSIEAYEDVLSRVSYDTLLKASV
jgi:adenosine deaminase